MARTVHALASVCVLASALGGKAHAQTAPPAPAYGGEAAPPDADAAMPKVKDPMLVPVPPAENVLTSWQDVMRFVRQRSTALHIAHAEVEQAHATHTRALAGALPTLTMSAALNHHEIKGTGPDLYANGGPSAAAEIPHPDTTLNGSLDFRQPLINFGAWYAIGTAQERERVAGLGAADVQRQTFATVAQAAVGVITANRVAESSRVSLASDLSTLDLTRRRAALGAASAVDVLRADQEVSLVRAQLVTADESLRQAREALGAALGFTGGWGIATDLRVEDLQRTASSVCRPVPELNQRTDIRSAERNVRAAERDRKAVDFLFVPTLDFVSRLGYTGYERASPNGKPITWTVGAQLAWTLYDGGDRYGQQRFTEAATTIAREQLTQKTRDAVLQAAQADRAILVAQANVEVATTARNIAKESARLSRLAFINGNGTSFDLVDSARRLREAEIDLLIKEFQVFQARLTAFLSRSNCSL